MYAFTHTFMAFVAKKKDVKLDPSNFAAYTLRQGECTDMATHGVPSWRIEMTERCINKKMEENVQ